MFPTFYMPKVAPSGWVEQAILTASDAQNDDRFGYSIDIDTNTVVVGAFLEDGLGTNRGAAYVYTRTGSTWTQQQKLVASDTEDEGWFGFSVAISGDTLVVGAPAQDNAGLNRGAAYVFTRTAGVWTQQTKLVASDQANADLFGDSVDIYSNTIVVGARGEDGAGTNRGAAYVYLRTAGVWGEQQKLTASDTADNDQFGWEVAIYEDTIAVGAPFDDGSASNTGSVYIFTRSGVTWTEEAKLVASDPAAQDNFGYALSLYMNTLLVGAPVKLSSTGAAYVFTRSGSTWTEQQKLTASDPEFNSTFGSTVSLYDDLLVIGAPAKDGVSLDSGASYVFALSGGTWTEQSKLIASNTEPDGRFGSSVSVYGSTLAIGSVGSETVGPAIAAGAAYIFVS